MFNSKFFKILAVVMIIGIFISGVHSVFAQAGEPPPSEQQKISSSTAAVGAAINAGATNAEINAAAVNARGGTGNTLYGIASIAGNVLTFVAGLIDSAIGFGNGVKNLPVVTLGFQIVLGIANLGFVLAIIVIAFATIFRLENYAMSKTLKNLVIAALLVNFSMVIAGAFISVSNTFSNYFLAGFDNGSIGDALGNLIDPQKLTQVAGADNPNWYDFIANPVSAVSKYITSLFFVTIFTLLIVLIFLALFVMLLIRGIVLSFLLIAMPLAWLASIFPSTSQYWGKWWTQFMRWVFFAPIVLFFIYIISATGNRMAGADFLSGYNRPNSAAVSINQNLPAGNLNNLGLADANSTVNNNQGNSTANNTSQSNTANLSQSSAVKAFEKSTNFPTGFFGYLSQLVIILGLLMGGVMAANSLGLSGASAVYGAAKGVGKWAGGWIGKKTLQGATYPLRRKGAGEGAESLAEKSQRWASGIKNPIGRFAAGLIARGAVNVAEKGGKQVKDSEAQVKNMSKDQAKTALLTTVSNPRKIALLKKLTDEKALGDIDIARYINEDTKKLFNSYGQGKAFGDMEKASISVEMSKAIKDKNAGASLKASEDFVAKLTKGDIDKSALKDIFSGKLKLGFSEDEMKILKESFARAISTVNPTLVANIVPKLDSKARNNFEETYSSVISGSPKIKENFGKLMMKYTEGPVLESEGLGEPIKTEEPIKKEV